MANAVPKGGLGELVPFPPRDRSTGGGDGGSPIEPASKEYVDLKIENAVSRLEGKFDLLNQRLASLERNTPTTISIWGAVFTGAVAVISIIIAALAFGGDRFDGGLGLADQKAAQSQTDAAQDAAMKELVMKVDALVDVLSRSAESQTEAIPD